MNVYETKTIGQLTDGNSYVGRGIVIGKSRDGKKAMFAYFIMGRSVNSRNRVFVQTEDGIRTQAFDPSKLADPSLIIYAPVRRYENSIIVTNGDQTDTIYDALAQGKTFAHALRTREFEPDGPNFTPRISGMLTLSGGDFTYQMSILKSAAPDGSACSRYFFEYPAVAGVGQFIHTYVCDGNPIPTFVGEPERVSMPDSLDAFTLDTWDHLDADNRISLYTCSIDLASGTAETRLINKNV